MSPLIENFAGKIAYWLIPRGFLALFRKYFKRKTQVTWKPLNSQSGSSTASSPVSRFKNLHDGERCFVLATGPSVNKQDLRKLSGELCIAVGQFHLHEHITEISPRYHVLAPSHPPFDFSDLDKVFSGLEDRYPEDMTYFLGHTAYEYSMSNFLRESSSYSFKNLYSIDYSNAKHLEEKNYNNPEIWDISLSPFALRTVVFEAIQIAVYMGVAEIYLIGCDHDYILNMKRVTDHHFYPEALGISDVEHLSPVTTEMFFKEYYYRWKQYRLINEYCSQIGCRIYNATEGGLLDVFPRVELTDLI